MEVSLSYLLGFELRWLAGGRFDGVYLRHDAAAVVASGLRCGGTTAHNPLHDKDPSVHTGDLMVRSALHRARSVAAQLEGRMLPRSGANAPPRRVRYFPSDRLRLLFGCDPFAVGYNCTESHVPAEVCPRGAPPLLVHSTFAAHAAWPSLGCLRLIPNLDQLTGSAADKIRAARAASEGRSWADREAVMVWVGTVKLPQREHFYSRRATAPPRRRPHMAAAAASHTHTHGARKSHDRATESHVSHFSCTSPALPRPLAPAALVRRPTSDALPCAPALPFV